jgi:murein DD-endopeptidase MepM/ murein hydrolase activator NlpD
MRGHAIGARATGFHRAPSGATFSYEWVRGAAGTAVLRGAIRSQLVPGVSEAQRVEYRAQIAGIDGAPDRLAEAGAMVDEAAARTAAGDTATAPSLVDVGRQGRTYSQRGASRLDGADLSGRIHAAMDVPGPTGTGVYAPAAGRVVSSGMVRGYGNLVSLVHEELPAPYAGRRFQTAYAHLSQRLVDGGSVAPGQAIGLVGNTRTDGDGDGGRVAGGMAPHLHFGVIELFGGAAAGAWSSHGE